MKIKLDGEEIDISPSICRFTEATLSEYISNSPSLYAYYGAKQADANYVFNKLEEKCEVLASRVMRQCKEEGCTDKLAEATAKSDPLVLEAKEELRQARRIKEYLFFFCKALERGHESALNMGYNVRKELGILGKSHIKENTYVTGEKLEELLNAKG